MEKTLDPDTLVELQILKFFVADPDPGSGAFWPWIRDEKIRIWNNILDPQHWSKFSSPPGTGQEAHHFIKCLFRDYCSILEDADSTIAAF